MAITVGQVSGIIAAAVFLMQHVFPNALVLVLVCLIGNRHSAVTWSVISRIINNSLWPIVLNSDTSASGGVHPTVNRLAYLRPIGMGLIAIAAIVTPLGLHEAVLPDREMRSVPFTYLQDNGPFGYGTMQNQESVWHSRQCSGIIAGLL